MKNLALLSLCVCALVPFAVAQSKSASSRTPRSVVEAYVQAWNHHDAAAFDRLLAPDGVHDDLAEGFHGQGPAQVKGFLNEIVKQQPDFAWKLGNIIESGNTVVAEWTWNSTYTGDSPNGPVKNQRISGRGACVVVVENGRIQRFTDYYDSASFFAKPPSGRAAAQ